MKQVRGLWMPDCEQHLIEMMADGPVFAGLPTYQFRKYAAAIPYIRNFRHAIDVGAHIGVWAHVLTHCFAHVSAFEPVLEHRDCFMMNVQEKNHSLYPYALGDDFGSVKLHTDPFSTMITGIAKEGEHSAEMFPLDHFSFNNVDFLKIDTEGFEFFVLKGGEKTIRRDKPCVIVEQRPDHGRAYGVSDTEAVALLESWGASVIEEICEDYIMAWR